MAVVIKTGNILEDSSQALVNPVNCVGVMGAGLAKQFKQKYPEYYQDYKNYCDDGSIQIGSCHLWYPSSKAIISFPTKYHWAQPSDISHIKDGLKSLKEIIKRFGIDSVAIPALGCGLGELNWNDVKPVVFNWANERSSELNTTIYTPFNQFCK